MQRESTSGAPRRAVAPPPSGGGQPTADTVGWQPTADQRFGAPVLLLQANTALLSFNFMQGRHATRCHSERAAR